MGNLFETKDVLGEKVICSQETWCDHIISGHDIMENNLPAVIDTIKAPDKIYTSSTPDRKIYFKKSSESTYSSHTKVITASISSSESVVVTAFPQKGIRGGINEQIYP